MMRWMSKTWTCLIRRWRQISMISNTATSIKILTLDKYTRWSKSISMSLWTQSQWLWKTIWQNLSAKLISGSMSKSSTGSNRKLKSAPCHGAWAGMTNGATRISMVTAGTSQTRKKDGIWMTSKLNSTTFSHRPSKLIFRSILSSKKNQLRLRLSKLYRCMRGEYKVVKCR